MNRNRIELNLFLQKSEHKTGTLWQAVYKKETLHRLENLRVALEVKSRRFETSYVDRD
jgi:hypothetical protein